MPGLTVSKSKKPLGQSLHEFDQQKQVEQVASMAATVLSLAGTSEIIGSNNTLVYNDEEQSLDISDSKTGETFARAKFDGETWQDQGSNLSSERTRNFSERITQKARQFKQEQQELQQPDEGMEL